MSEQSLLMYSNRIIFWTLVIFFPSQLQYAYGFNVKKKTLDYSDDPQKINENQDSRLMTSYDEMIVERISLSSNDILSWTAVTMMISLFVASPFFVLPLLWFLQDLPLNKQCIMNCLYQDVIKINLLFVWSWAFSAITFKILAEKFMIDHLEAFVEFAVIANEIVYFLIMIYLSLIGGLRVYVAKFGPTYRCFWK